MFNEVATTYDRATPMLSLGQDVHWKRELVSTVSLCDTDVVVDLGCGTGDLIDMLPKTLHGTYVGIDVSPVMLSVAERRIPHAKLLCMEAECPYGVRATHVFAGYLFRNVTSTRAVLLNAHACMADSGVLHVLDMFRPCHFPRIRVGIMGAWCTLQDALLGHRQGAYGYIPESIHNFMTVNDFCRLATECGFQTTCVRPRLFGAAHIVRLKKL
jgi:demethylmenaquinone methyltransferase/2-methoxy-6-polyprenyl-1,4-benzoquinol methylase